VPPETHGDPETGPALLSALAEIPRPHSEYGAWITGKIAEYSSRGEADTRGPTIYDLLRSTDAEAGKITTSERITEIVADGGLILAASAENITVTILTALFHLLRSPEILERLLTSDSRPAMLSGHCYEGSTLLSAIINESLRINPPVPGALFRELKTDLCFDNVHMPRGTLVGVSAYVLHHDAANFEDPESFVPDRWLRNELRCSREAFCPFGFGARNCVGKQLAIDVTGLVIEQFVNKLEWRLGGKKDESQLRYEDFFVSYPAGVEARIRGRKK
jgi:cytochrome P450